jgi:hypothetical protein
VAENPSAATADRPAAPSEAAGAALSPEEARVRALLFARRESASALAPLLGEAPVFREAPAPGTAAAAPAPVGGEIPGVATGGSAASERPAAALLKAYPAALEGLARLFG